MSFQIDKNLPIPAATSSKYPWAFLEVGDSFFVPRKYSSELRAAAQSWLFRNPGVGLTFRTAMETGVRGCRVWRVA